MLYFTKILGIDNIYRKYRRGYMKKGYFIYLAEGFEEVEALTVVDYLRKERNINVRCTVSINAQEGNEVKGAHEITVLAE